MIRRVPLLLLLLILTTGCSGIIPTSESPETESPATAAAPSPTAAATAQATPSAQATEGPSTLRLWVPPEFDPASGTPAGDLLQARLEAFTRRRGLEVEVRVKVLDGPGGLLDTLTTAGAAAPLALPDVVALPYPALESAALKGLLYPYDGLSSLMDDSDWYDFARQLATLESSVFGLPFAGDTLVMAYRPEAVEQPPRGWPAALEMNAPMAFAAADPDAMVTLALYQAAGGSVQDEQGRPVLEVEPLEEVLTFYQQGSQSGLLPFWLTQFQNTDQVWESFLESQVDQAVVWGSDYLGGDIEGVSLSWFPTPNAAPYSLSGGWVWALASPQAESRQAASQLAEFLVDPGFLAGWNQAAGLLPTRPSSMGSWEDGDVRIRLSRILNNSQVYPSIEVLTSVGPLLQEATVQVLKEEAEPAEAAQDAVNRLPAP